MPSAVVQPVLGVSEVALAVAEEISYKCFEHGISRSDFASAEDIVSDFCEEPPKLWIFLKKSETNHFLQLKNVIIQDS